jgi:oxygen-independent coproporphyrinogen III oxidase
LRLEVRASPCGTVFGLRPGMPCDRPPAPAAPSDTAALIRRYDRPGPRYTSYPTAVEFHQDFGEAAYRERLAAAAATPDAPLSLYVHVPFCAERCWYCGCTMIAAKSYGVAGRYLDYLAREIALLAAHLGGRRRLAQLHWGGGTPTYLSAADIARLHHTVTGSFRLDPSAEQAIEIDPRVTTREQLALLRTLGFNRLSIGVQDLDPQVQAAIGRHQSQRATRDTFECARRLRFASVNFDLVYGLPGQTLEGFRATLDAVVDMGPDRIAVYSYAHVPWLRPHQKLIDAALLPDAGLKYELIGAAVDTLTGAGYVAIGMDHFALPGDDLAIAAAEHRLHRNFMGYTTLPASDAVGAGLSAIGDVRGAYAQNHKKLSAYYAALDEDRLPTERGRLLTHDDLVRRHVIAELMCNFHVSRQAVARRFDIDFDRYFAAELGQLTSAAGPAADGFVDVNGDGIAVTTRGRLFVRTVCMVFDRYLPTHAAAPTFSRTI